MANEEPGYAYSTLYTGYAIFLLLQKEGKGFNAETVAFVLFVVLFNIFNMFSSQSTRVALPYRVFLLVLVPLLIYSNSLRNIRLFIFVTLCFCVVYFVFTFIIGNAGDISPYYTWWGEPDYNYN